MVTINVSARSAYFSEPDIKINLSVITYLELTCNMREKCTFIGTSLNLERVISLGSLMQYLFISVRVTLVMKHCNQIHTGEKRDFFLTYNCTLLFITEGSHGSNSNYII